MRLALILISFLFAGMTSLSHALEVPSLKRLSLAHLQQGANPQSNGEQHEPLTESQVNPKLDTRLRHLISKKTRLRTDAARVPQMTQDKVKVILHLRDGESFGGRGITALNGRILMQRKNLVAAELPLDQVENLLAREGGIEFARLPHKFFPVGVTSEGVGQTNATDFHIAGFRGAGVKVAVMDIGFKNLSGAQSAGDLPFNLSTQDFTGRGLQTQYKHGTACAEIVHDMAPDAELHLLKISDEEDLYRALDYCKANGIHIISVSIGTYGSGPGNGTGPIHDACDEARASGILVVAAAGNSGNTYSTDGEPIPIGSHWEGQFIDSNNDNTHEFSPNAPGNVLIAVPGRDDDGNPEQDEVSIVMRWNDWPHATTDYDLYLYAYDYQNGVRGALVGYSTALQNGSQPPVEAIVLDLPDAQEFEFYELLVVRKPNQPVGKELEVHLGTWCAFLPRPSASLIATSSSSIWEPADAESVLAVGAINQVNWTSGPQEDFSSQGPTNAWAESSSRIKPDICGPDAVSTQTFGGSAFLGTSAAAPHVAGAAALILSMHPNMTPNQVQALLESSAKDMGTFGKDNFYGSGRLYLDRWNSNSPPVFDMIAEETFHEGRLNLFTLTASDPDKDKLTYSATSEMPTGAILDPNTGILSWRPTYRQQGTHVISFKVSDGYASDHQSTGLIVLDESPIGDIDDSGVVDLVDAVTCMQVLTRLGAPGSVRADYAASGADVNGDNLVGLEELTFILQALSDVR